LPPNQPRVLDGGRLHFSSLAAAATRGHAVHLLPFLHFLKPAFHYNIGRRTNPPFLKGRKAPSSVANPGCFIPDRIRPLSHPGSKHFFIPDPDSYMKSGMQTYRYFFVASYAFRKKVLFIVKMTGIRDPEKIPSGARIRKKVIPDPEKIHPGSRI
jgi:hypothetical protein